MLLCSCRVPVELQTSLPYHSMVGVINEVCCRCATATDSRSSSSRWCCYGLLGVIDAWTSRSPGLAWYPWSSWLPESSCLLCSSPCPGIQTVRHQNSMSCTSGLRGLNRASIIKSSNATRVSSTPALTRCAHWEALALVLAFFKTNPFLNSQFVFKYVEFSKLHWNQKIACACARAFCALATNQK